MLFLLHFLNGWVRFDKKGNSIYPSIAISLIACTFGLAWRMLAVYSIIDVKKLFFIAAVFYSADFRYSPKRTPPLIPLWISSIVKQPSSTMPPVWLFCSSCMGRRWKGCLRGRGNGGGGR